MRKVILSLLSLFIFINTIQGRENYYYKLQGLQKNRNLKMTNLCQFIGDDQKKVNCQIETGSFLPPSVRQNNETVSLDQLKIVEYNIDRNGLGGDGPNEQGIQPLIEAIKSLGDPDIIILSEVARDCPQWASVNGAEEIARAFQMDWAYSVEFVELNEELLDNDYQCTIGNAILSNRPLSNIIQKEFESQCCMFGGRAGGRVAIKATVEAYNITVVSSHLESGTGFSDFVDAMLIRDKQSRELVKMIDPIEKNQKLIMIGGDFNSPLRQFKKGDVFKCFIDPFMEKYTWPHRNTCVGDELGMLGLSAFDYMYFRNHEQYRLESYICKTKACTGFSDHFPLKVNLFKK